ncbi:MAG: SCO family protein [Candidatus Methylomirabilales bacterium]
MRTGRLRQKSLVGTLVLVGAAGVLLLAVSVLFAPSKERRAAEQSPPIDMRQPDPTRLPAFTLIERSGRKVTLAHLAGKVWIADFVWTRCPDACPLMSAMMARLQEEFADEPDLWLVSISVDPEFDTPAVLDSYAAKFRADPDRWLFLTGEKGTIYRLIREGFKLLVLDPADDKTSHDRAKPLVNTARLARRFLRQQWFGPAVAWAPGDRARRGQPGGHSDRGVRVDRSGWVRGYYSSDEKEALVRLKQDARELLRAGRGA